VSGADCWRAGQPAYQCGGEWCLGRGLERNDVVRCFLVSGAKSVSHSLIDTLITIFHVYTIRSNQSEGHNKAAWPALISPAKISKRKLNYWKPAWLNGWRLMPPPDLQTRTNRRTSPSRKALALWRGLNPLDSKGNYSATSNNTKLVHVHWPLMIRKATEAHDDTAIRWLVHWPLMGGLLHLVQRGGA